MAVVLDLKLVPLQSKKAAVDRAEQGFVHSYVELWSFLHSQLFSYCGIWGKTSVDKRRYMKWKSACGSRAVGWRPLVYTQHWFRTSDQCVGPPSNKDNCEGPSVDPPVAVFESY